METKTKTDKAYRELTASECKIAIAQIEDRLKRIAKAQKEIIKKFYPRLEEEKTDEESEEIQELNNIEYKIRDET